MNINKEPVIGIVGGMGPQAGVELCSRITALTGATRDQEHLSVVMMSFPSHIVDRTSFLEGQSVVNPGYNIAAIVRKLELVGASVVGMACNTAYVPEIFDVIVQELQSSNCHVHLLNMPLETCRQIQQEYPHVRKIGIMATNGSYRFSTYPEILRQAGYQVVLPDETFQQQVVHRAIYDDHFGLKSNAREVSPEALLLIDESIDYFRKRGVELIILGCTEFSFVPAIKNVKDMLIIDSTASLAKALVREATTQQVLLAVGPESIASR
ncbi:aspartate/glutamate racemase family protein [Chitinophaga varians]|uniref:aspartate/glutamate racemase family protein n=1 Tax=Chitinophaga varians TaxID=2202339 RepID=UPI00165FF000|nr:amino acid racemase [Chitinophaga varians]MBC9914885.1 aspartate/glutamate racemase family protein [Chitinophaga varians]